MFLEFCRSPVLWISFIFVFYLCCFNSNVCSQPANGVVASPAASPKKRSPSRSPSRSRSPDVNVVPCLHFTWRSHGMAALTNLSTFSGEIWLEALHWGRWGVCSGLDICCPLCFLKITWMSATVQWVSFIVLTVWTCIAEDIELEHYHAVACSQSFIQLVFCLLNVISWILFKNSCKTFVDSCFMFSLQCSCYLRFTPPAHISSYSVMN